jgi:hypothetical protein
MCKFRRPCGAPSVGASRLVDNRRPFLPENRQRYDNDGNDDAANDNHIDKRCRGTTVKAEGHPHLPPFGERHATPMRRGLRPALFPASAIVAKGPAAWLRWLQSAALLLRVRTSPVAGSRLTENPKLLNTIQ